MNHLDSNKTNNRAENLEWTTVSGNTKHCYDNNPLFRAQVHQNSKIASDKRRLKLEVFNKEGKVIGIFDGIKKAAEALGINEKTVRNIKDKRFSSNRLGLIITVCEGGDA